MGGSTVYMCANSYILANFFQKHPGQEATPTNINHTNLLTSLAANIRQFSRGVAGRSFISIMSQTYPIVY